MFIHCSLEEKSKVKDARVKNSQERDHEPPPEPIRRSSSTGLEQQILSALIAGEGRAQGGTGGLVETEEDGDLVTQLCRLHAACSIQR